MKMSLLGPVGSGKRTQSQRISERLDRRAGPGSDRGRYRADMRSRVTSTGRAGPGRRDHGSGAAHLQPAGTWILDDFPRPIAQACALDEELVERIVGDRQQSLATARVYPRALSYPGPGEGPGPRTVRAARGRLGGGPPAAVRSLP